MVAAAPPPPTRIPNLPMGPITDKNGNPTDDESTFRQALVTSLQNYMGGEGLVMPSQSAADIATIVAHVDPQNGAYTCRPGTLLYDTTNDRIIAVVLVAGVPTAKVVTVT